ncbi:beta strand repeat-containing protein [Noviherbaspirillum sp. Root189]|uniref:beta strand repeat-containing protein n=1 Tax=Noviherbaspirillum sp. Root189 TaxID=1736487 RepID=UPI00070DC74A|nr:hypothetical protein [Noviherbaspirillum sp. Root189]KRB85144.1 hypothetical protein ASE07_21515 [Noviherbaspirillum sp. Root189]
MTVKADGTAADTISAFDSIDGGAGNDALNVYSDGTNNLALPASATVKNVETINIFNSTAAFNTGTANTLDASKFVGATTINQSGLAANVTKLGETTTAGFKSIATGALSVTAANAATSATVALTSVGEAASLTVQADAAATTSALTSVTVSGTRTDTDANGKLADLALTVVVGKDVQTLKLNTATNVDLTASKIAGAKDITVIDASASTGAVKFAPAGGNTTLKTLLTGAGNDTVTISTTTSNTAGAEINALVGAGAGDDKITVSTTGTGKTEINADDGNDTVTLTTALTTSTRINGGAGTDKLVLSGGGTLVAGDYALIGATVSNVEKLAFGAAAVADASKLAQFSEIGFFTTGTNTVTEVAAAQTVVALGDLTATAAGYVAAKAEVPYQPAGADPVANPEVAYKPAVPATYAGTVNVTAQAAATPAAQSIVVNAETANVKVVAASGVVGAAAASQATTNIATITGDVKTLSVVTANGVDQADLTTAAAKADTLSVAKLTVDATHLASLTTLTLSGNGSVTLDDSAAAAGAIKLATIDASALGGTLAYGANAGDITGGLTFAGNANIAETIKLGAGHDVITVNSTYGKMDTVSGFDAVKETNTAKSTTDTLVFGTLNTSTAGATGLATKVTLSTNATSLELAFVEAAAASHAGTDAIVTFQFGGNTYLFKDGADAGNLDASDAAVTIVGLVDFTKDFDAYVVV